MSMTDLFRQFGCLFEAYRYWSILLIAGVVITVIPLNILYKKKLTGNLSRLSKVCGFLSAYIVAAIYISVFTAITKVAEFSVGYMLGSTLALGFCSQAAWEFIKIIRDYGAKRFFLWIITSLERERLISSFAEKYGIDKKIVKILISGIQKAESVTDETTGESLLEISKFRNKLGAFLESEDLETAFKELLDLTK